MFQNFLKKLVKLFKFICKNTPKSWWGQVFNTNSTSAKNFMEKKKFECKPLEEFFSTILQGNWKIIFNRDSYISILADLKKEN